MAELREALFLCHECWGYGHDMDSVAHSRECRANPSDVVRYVPEDVATRNWWVRGFNRLETAVRIHIEKKVFTDDVDDALHAAHRAVMKEVGPSGGGLKVGLEGEGTDLANPVTERSTDAD